MLLEVREIKVSYGRSLALKGVSLEVGAGAVVALIGSNGAGKTTTLNAISGTKALAEGQIWFEGQRIDSLGPQDIARLGIRQVPEGRGIFASMTVLENIELGAYLRRDKAAIARELSSIYERFPVLKERRTQAAGSLSGGEQQMVAIARALIAKPKLFLMDEPSLGLAPKMVEMIEDVIVELHSAGASILLVEQNAAMALRVASRGYVFALGEVVLSGDAESLLKNEELARAYLGV